MYDGIFRHNQSLGFGSIRVLRVMNNAAETGEIVSPQGGKHSCLFVCFIEGLASITDNWCRMKDLRGMNDGKNMESGKADV